MLENKDIFSNIFSKNLKYAVKKYFKNQKEFAELFGESPQTVNKWLTGIALPDLYKITKLCNILGISIDYLVFGEPSNLTSTSIDYAIFDEVVELTNAFAKEYNIVVGGRQYLAIYENVVNLKRLNDELKTKDIFTSLIPTIKTLWIPPK